MTAGRDPGALGRTLAAARARSGLTLRAMGELAGVSNCYLSQLETGAARNLSARTLDRIAAAYGIPATTLLGLSGVREPGPRGSAVAAWLRTQAAELRRRADEFEAYADELDPPPEARS